MIRKRKANSHSIVWLIDTCQDVRTDINARATSSADEAAFAEASRRFANVAVLRSPNVHEVRGYNRAAALARGGLLVFSQDDRLPPPSTQKLAHQGWFSFTGSAVACFSV